MFYKDPFKPPPLFRPRIDWPRVTLLFFLALILVGAPWYAILSLGFWYSFQRIVLLTILIFGFTVVGSILTRDVVTRLKQNDRLVDAGGSFAIATGLFGVAVVVKDVLLILPVNPGLLAVSGVGFGVLVVGVVCFWFRSNFRRFWGFTEVAVGMLLPMQRASVLPADPAAYGSDFWIFALTAGIYLVVRGLDNVSQARKEQPKEGRYGPL